MFRLLVLKPLRVDELLHLPLKSLSGGELQRLAVVVCLGTPAEVYLLDEPSAALDCEQRVAVAKVIKRWTVGHLRKTVFVVEHDFAMAAILADRVSLLCRSVAVRMGVTNCAPTLQVIVFSGQPGVYCKASAPCLAEIGFNHILRSFDVTMHLDPKNGRPRVNKRGGQLDRAAKAAGRHFQFVAAGISEE